MKKKIDYAAQAQALRGFELKHNFLINENIKTYDNSIGRAMDSKEKWEEYLNGRNSKEIS